MGTTPRLGRAARVALVMAAVYAAGLVVAGFLVPVYESDAATATGTVNQAGTVTSTSAEAVSRHSETLVAVNGMAAAVVLAAPLLVTLLVGTALLLRARRGALVVAWTLTGLLGALNALAMLSVGMFLLPVTAGLLVACALSGQGAPTPQGSVSP